MDSSVKKVLTNREKWRGFQERLKAGILFCAMETCLHCPDWGYWRSIADGADQLHGGKGWVVLLAKYMRQKQRTILQPDRKSEGNGVGHHVKHKQKATLECHLLNLTIFVVDLIRSELVWHFWLNSVSVFILSLQKNTSWVSLSVLFCFLI